jgi:hypothetical protein
VIGLLDRLVLQRRGRCRARRLAGVTHGGQHHRTAAADEWRRRVARERDRIRTRLLGARLRRPPLPVPCRRNRGNPTSSSPRTRTHNWPARAGRRVSWITSTFR